MAGRGTEGMEDRDRRSLRVQIDEDDDVIELDTDYGDGVSKFLNDVPVGFSPGHGKGRGSAFCQSCLPFHRLTSPQSELTGTS